jgi:glycosyltransferase involved in cell wall biosynthesis
MPAWNAQAYLSESVASILGQTLRDLELIVVDDGSDDSTPELLAGWAARDPRLRVIRHPERRGVVAAANRSLEAAGGKYVARMDADDVALPERLARQVAYLDAHPEIFLVGSDAILIDAAGRVLGRRRVASRPERIAEVLPQRNCIIHPTALFRREPRFEYREKMHYVEDYDLCLRLLTRGERLANLPVPLLRYRRHAESLSLRGRVHQVLFGDLAREFYRQRRREGRDAYDAFDPATILAVDPRTSTDERVLRIEIERAFALNALPETRAGLRRYFRVHGLARRPRLLPYYAATFLPPPLLARIKRLLRGRLGGLA